MFTGTDYSTAPVVTVSFTVEYYKSKVSGCFVYLKPNVRNNLSHCNFRLQCETIKPPWKGFLSESSILVQKMLKAHQHFFFQLTSNS